MNFMKKNRSLFRGMVAGMVLLFLLVLIAQEVQARAGGGRSGGYRGSRTFSAPRSTTPYPGIAPSPRPAPAPYGNTGGAYRSTPSYGQPTGNPFWRGLAGGLAGGFLGSLLFSGLGRAAAPGLGSARAGLGLLDILLILAVGYFLFRFIRNRGKRSIQEERPAGHESSDAPRFEYIPPPYPTENGEVEAGLARIRSLDPTFDPEAFKEWVQDLFFRIQAAWGNQDLGPVAAFLTPQMMEIFARDLEEQKRKNQVNRLENIAVRRVEITEAWQEEGNDYLTVLFYANLLDYVVDKTSGAVLSGSKTEPVKFREYWTFVRPVGGGPWKLSAIQQEE
jgi:predicted lipid-binding transport protein (Tim44 family)